MAKFILCNQSLINVNTITHVDCQNHTEDMKPHMIIEFGSIDDEDKRQEICVDYSNNGDLAAAFNKLIAHIPFYCVNT